MEESMLFHPDGHQAVGHPRLSQAEAITDEEYRFLMKRRAIPISARDVLDIMLNAVYAQLAPPKTTVPDPVEKIPAIDKQDPFFSRANMELLRESKRQMESGQIVSKSWEELEKLANG